jgi:acetylornithine deacetylase/succinyl-diaminopimelate desuccinylase-like protein
MSERTFVKDLAEWVAIPSISAKPAFAKDCARAAAWLAGFLKKAGFKVELPAAGGNPVVWATHDAPKGAPHIVIYGHYDVQPPEPLEQWKTSPFELTLKKGVFYARGAADDKGPTFALLNGVVDALRANSRLPVRITTLIEGEEESGSGTFARVLRKIRARIGKVDAVILSDTESQSPSDLIVTTGVRGMIAFDLKLTALARDLHSGQGGPVPNAVRELSRVVGGLYDARGWVNIPGFYQGLIKAPAVELKALKRLYSPSAYARQIGAKGFYPLGGQTPFEAMRFFPSLELNGIFGGYEGEGSKTIIPATATAKLTCRVAPGQDPRKLGLAIWGELLKRVDRRLFDAQVLIHEAGAPAYGVPLPHLDKTVKGQESLKNAFLTLEKAVRGTTHKAPIYERDGASIPILTTLTRELGAEAIMLGLATKTAQMHSPNENVPLELLENGRRVWRDFFLGLAK